MRGLQTQRRVEMDIYKAFGIYKTNDDDGELINKLHSYWQHIKPPILGRVDRATMHEMGIDELLHRMNVGPQKPKEFIPEHLTPEGKAIPFDTPPLNMVDLPPDLAHLHGQPSPLNRESLKQNLNNPAKWGLEDFFDSNDST